MRPLHTVRLLIAAVICLVGRTLYLQHKLHRHRGGVSLRGGLRRDPVPPDHRRRLSANATHALPSAKAISRSHDVEAVIVALDTAAARAAEPAFVNIVVVAQNQLCMYVAAPLPAGAAAPPPPPPPPPTCCHYSNSLTSHSLQV